MKGHASPGGEGSCRHQRLRRHHRLRRRADFQRCYRRGRKKHGALASLHYHSLDGQDVRLGITASRKVGNSVVRHRLKRQVREVFRRYRGRDRLKPMDIVVHLKPASAKADYAALASELEGLLTALPQLKAGTQLTEPRL